MVLLRERGRLEKVWGLRKWAKELRLEDCEVFVEVGGMPETGGPDGVGAVPDGLKTGSLKVGVWLRVNGERCDEPG